MDTPPFTLRFSPTPRGARLARRLAAQRMDAWGWTYGSTANDTAELIVAELAANAVTHGRVPGRDAELRMLLCLPDLGLARIEVSDTRGECLPRPTDGDPDKTVWAVVAVRAGAVLPEPPDESSKVFA